MLTVLLTGATGGIGTEISHFPAKNGYNLILLSIEKENLDKLRQKLLKEYAVEVRTICCDVSNYESLKEQLVNVKNVDVLINCAGISGPVGLFLENDIYEWEKAIKVNLFGTAYTCQLLIPILIQSRRGKIINFAGGGSAYPRKFHTAYASSKTAIIRFTETLSLEYPVLDINVIAPGAHKTKMWDEQIHDNEPKKWADPVRMEKFILFLCNKDSDLVTGRFIHLNDEWDRKDYIKMKKDFYTLRRVDNNLLTKLGE